MGGEDLETGRQKRREKKNRNRKIMTLGKPNGSAGSIEMVHFLSR